jgi:hypothetical protein
MGPQAPSSPFRIRSRASTLLARVGAGNDRRYHGMGRAELKCRRAQIDAALRSRSWTMAPLAEKVALAEHGSAKWQLRVIAFRR